jgi:hypothetical protein
MTASPLMRRLYLSASSPDGLLWVHRGGRFLRIHPAKVLWIGKYPGQSFAAFWRSLGGAIPAGVNSAHRAEFKRFSSLG